MKIIIIGTDPAMIFKFHGPLVRFLISRGFIVHLVGNNLTPSSPYYAKLEVLGAVCHAVWMDRTGTNPVRDFGLFNQYSKLISKISPDIVLAYTAKPVIYGMVAAWLNKTPKRIALITGLGFAFTGPAKGRKATVRRIMQSLYRFSLSKTHHIIFQNPDDCQDFENMKIVQSNVDVQIIRGCGVDTAIVRQVPPPMNSPVRFVMVARLLTDKGVDEYLEAASIVTKSRYDAQFVLVGGEDSNPASISKDTLKRLKHGQPVNWVGHVQDVQDYLIESDVFVLPSYREGLPQSTIEALAIGRAVITTDVPGCRETVEQGVNGLLVSAQDAHALSEAMMILLKTPTLITQFGLGSRARAEEVFSSLRINQEYLKIMNTKK